MSGFRCLVRSMSGSGQVRYRFGRAAGGPEFVWRTGAGAIALRAWGEAADGMRDVLPRPVPERPPTPVQHWRCSLLGDVGQRVRRLILAQFAELGCS
jgi:hypothetical protein